MSSKTLGTLVHKNIEVELVASCVGEVSSTNIRNEQLGKVSFPVQHVMIHPFDAGPDVPLELRGDPMGIEVGQSATIVTGVLVDDGVELTQIDTLFINNSTETLRRLPELEFLVSFIEGKRPRWAVHWLSILVYVLLVGSNLYLISQNSGNFILAMLTLGLLGFAGFKMWRWMKRYSGFGSAVDRFFDSSELDALIEEGVINSENRANSPLQPPFDDYIRNYIN